jgi:FtsH-binding integral membrane protein
MSYSTDYYGAMTAAQAPAEARAAFIRRTYAHVAGAILAFIAIQAVLLNLPGIDQFMASIIGHLGGLMWLVVLGGFMVVSMVAQSWATSNTSPGLQYAGLGLFVVGESLIFLPLLWIANTYFPGAIGSAGIMTGFVVVGLTLAVFMTGKDYSFLGPIISVGCLVSLGFIVASIIFGFNMGVFFCYAMVALMSLYIVYDTSNIIHRYNTDQHVAAALGLFASIATLFWYILQIAMGSSRD